MGKGEIARYEQVLLFPQCFLKACFPGASNGVIVWEWVKFGRERFDWLIAWCLTQFSTVFQLYRSDQCICQCCPRVLLASTPHNVISKPLAAFPHNHCRNNGQRRERNESCRNEYHQSSEKILAKPGIEPATSCYQLSYGTRLGRKRINIYVRIKRKP